MSLDLSQTQDLDLLTQLEPLVLERQSLKTTSETRLDELNDEIKGLLVRADVLKIAVAGYAISYNPATKPRETLDKDKLKLFLVERGVSTEIINSAFEYATSKGKPGDRLDIRSAE